MGPTAVGTPYSDGLLTQAYVLGKIIRHVIAATELAVHYYLVPFNGLAPLTRSSSGYCSTI